MNCTGIIGRLLGHNFVGRYHTIPPMRRLESGTARDIVAVNTANSERIYVADVCTRCGAITNREKP